ncbi:hypothetical protein BRARA_A00276 [Brassica rapa]|uniref:Uncharacterized protein n=1 Tax=Brassica campestris TaxID=3711 RepID=A0A398AIK9_BRACM|nr:hypothetical protein BRARA_A00276 [Brassica rapa]
MTNPEKMKVDGDTEKEKEDSSDEQWSDEESAMREIVLGLPALSISSATFGVSIAVDEEEEARLNEQAVVAADGGEGGRGVGIVMDVDRVEEEKQEVTESGTAAKFDLNKSPPKDDDEEEDKTK